MKKLSRFKQFINESNGKGALSDLEFTEVESIMIELEDLFDVERCYDKNEIPLNHYYLGHLSNAITNGNWDISLAMNLNEDLYISSSNNQRFNEIYDFVDKEIQDRLNNLGYKTKITRLGFTTTSTWLPSEYKADTWNYIPTGIRLDISLDLSL